MMLHLNKNIDDMYLLKVYFPKLYENDIINISSYEKILKKCKNLIN